MITELIIPPPRHLAHCTNKLLARGDFGTQNRVTLGKPPQQRGEGVGILPVFFYKEKGGGGGVWRGWDGFPSLI